MNAIILINDNLQGSFSVLENELVVDKLIDKNDYAFHLYFEYDYRNIPILSAFK